MSSIELLVSQDRHLLGDATALSQRDVSSFRFVTQRVDIPGIGEVSPFEPFSLCASHCILACSHTTPQRQFQTLTF
jgi:hypothetical protein